MNKNLDALAGEKTITYMGFLASYGWSNASGCWIGFLLHTESDIFFRFDKEEEAMDALKDAVDRLLADCRVISKYYRGFNDSRVLQ